MEQMEIEMMNQREKMEKFSRDYASMRDILFVVMENKTAEFARVMEGLNAIEKSRSIVAFSAAAKNHQTVSAGNQPFVFESVITNVGNAYNYTSGHFVAPVSGTYVFYSSILSMAGASFEAYIAVNGSIKVRMHESGNNGPRYGMASQSAIVELNAGDVVSVNSPSSVKVHGNTYTTFSGFLIRQFQ
ncbi:C1q-related factor-like [Mercenaria mercenaria]|uniref:C1q-related factor-like n=1 Tax=Mercenaria mercenaria TaxID=6596 RepID=UPI00234EF161|nr:C1q-related factor-like [Mercenaria mercenaria]